MITGPELLIALAKIPEWGEHLAIKLLRAIARLLSTRVSLIYLLHEYTERNLRLDLFVSDVNQMNDEGNQVQNFFVLPQGFRSFPSVFPRATWGI